MIEKGEVPVIFEKKKMDEMTPIAKYFEDMKNENDLPKAYETQKLDAIQQNVSDGEEIDEMQNDLDGECENESPEGEKNVLTDEEKAKIKEETGWSDEIIDSIQDMEEYEVYKNADLHEVVIDGKPCLAKDINLDYVDPKTGLTNRELMEKGRSPIDEKTGEKIELHHIGQEFDSPLAELCENSEHGDGKDSILHDKKTESWRQDPEKKNHYNNVVRPNHWKERAKENS